MVKQMKGKQMSSVRLSKKHCLNPTIPTCFFCGQSKNEIMLLGAAGDKIAKDMGKEDGEMPMNCCMDMSPCEECAGYMKQGIMFISIRDGETNKEQPYRTGKLWVLKEEAVNGFLKNDSELLDNILKCRFCFIEDSIAEQIGLTNLEEKEEVKQDENNG